MGKMYFGAGTFAAYTTASQATLAKRPSSLDEVNAAALPLAGLSAALQSIDAIEPRVGETVVVVGAAGGIGGYAVQMLRATGAHVIGVNREVNRDYVLSDGAAEFVDHEAGDPVEPIRKQHPQGVDAVLATTGDKELVGRYQGLLREGSRITSMRGAVDVEELAKRGIRGANIGTKTTSEGLARLAREPQIERFRLERAGDAISAVAGGHARGKKVVLVALSMNS